MIIDPILLNEAYTNNTFDLKILEESLNDIKQTSFNFLYKLQLEMTGYKRFNLKMSDLILTQRIIHKVRKFPRKYVAHIKSSFIDPNKRLKFRESEFYNKELNLFQITANPDIFTYIFLIFIDGKFIDCVDIVCRDDTTTFIFDIAEGSNTAGIPKEYFDELMAKNADITIYFIPNCLYGVYQTNINVLNKYKDNLALSRFNLAGNLDDDTKYITFINENDLLFTSVITDTENSKDSLRFIDNNFNEFKSKYVHLNIFGLRNLLDMINIPGHEEYFSIPIQDMPVPKENIMIFRNINGKKIFAHDISLEMYYPNIYKIVGNTNNDNLTLFVFYFDDTETVGLKYENELSLYYKFTSNILEKYKNNTIPEIIKNFDPKVYNYSIKDFEASEYYDDHFKYKIEKLRKWVKENNEIVRRYLNNQYKRPIGYYIDVSNVDLQSKIRENNFNEIKNASKHESFNEPRYVFILRDELKDGLMHMRYFIDGYFYVPDKVYKENGYLYCYIPTTLIKEDSIIEIEKFLDYMYTDSFRFTNLNDRKRIKLHTENVHVNKNDIFFVDTETKYYLNSDFFSIVIQEDGMEFELIGDTFKEVKEFDVKINNDLMLNKNITMYIRKRAFCHEWIITSEDEKIDPVMFDLDSIKDKRHYRVFRNGRLIPLHLYNIDFLDKITDKFAVNILMEKYIGDHIVVECSPFKYKQICEIGEINENGFVDLAGIIDKPFDLRWYDVYLNGIKLNKTNITVISPTKILIKNVKTRKRLVILEKNRDPEFFPITEIISPSDMIWDNVEEIRNTILSAQEPIPDEIEDVVTKDVSELIEDMIHFYELFMKYMFINPDEKQITNEIISSFETILTDNDCVLLNPDISPRAIRVLEIFPKINNQD